MAERWTTYLVDVVAEMAKIDFDDVAETSDYETLRDVRNSIYDLTDRLDAVLEDLAKQITREAVPQRPARPALRIVQ